MGAPPPVSAGQQKLLQVARRQLGLDETAWRALVERTTGQPSTRGLGQARWGRLVDELTRLGFRSTSRRKPFGQRADMATDRQVSAIRAAWNDWTGKPGEVGLATWLERTFRASHLRFLSAADAGGALGALKGMLERKRAAAERAGAEPAPSPEARAEAVPLAPKLG